MEIFMPPFPRCQGDSNLPNPAVWRAKRETGRSDKIGTPLRIAHIKSYPTHFPYDSGRTAGTRPYEDCQKCSRIFLLISSPLPPSKGGIDKIYRSGRVQELILVISTSPTSPMTRGGRQVRAPRLRYGGRGFEQARLIQNI